VRVYFLFVDGMCNSIFLSDAEAGQVGETVHRQRPKSSVWLVGGNLENVLTVHRWVPTEPEGDEP
jgi:hypothetical protein